MRTSSSTFRYEHIKSDSSFEINDATFTRGPAKQALAEQMGVSGELNLAGRTETQFWFVRPKQAENIPGTTRGNLTSFFCLAAQELGRLLTIHYVENERQHRPTGGGVWDMHGVFPDVKPQRVFIQHRLVL